MTTTKTTPKKKPATAAKKPAASEFKTYTDVKTPEDAFKVMGYDYSAMEQLRAIKAIPEHLRNAQAFDYELLVVHEAINKIMGFVPDAADYNQRKYWTWFWVKRVKKSKQYPSGFGFSYSGANYDYSYTGVGPRLCVGDAIQAQYIATQFEHLYIGKWF